MIIPQIVIGSFIDSSFIVLEISLLSMRNSKNMTILAPLILISCQMRAGMSSLMEEEPNTKVPFSNQIFMHLAASTLQHLSLNDY